MSKKTKRHLEVLTLPPMQCDEGCSDCCSAVLCTEERYRIVRAFAKENNIVPLDQGTTCPWYQGGRCAVYPVRPLICHIFGHTEELLCSRGYNRNVRSETAYKILRKFAPTPTRFLHEILEEVNPDYRLDANLPGFLIAQRDRIRESLTSKAPKHR